MMRKSILLLAALALLATGCQTGPKARIDPCPLPTGYILPQAIDQAEHSLIMCPERLDDVFTALVEIAKHKPDNEHRILIREMLVRLAKKGHISERYGKDLYNRYFAIQFVSLPDVKIYNLGAETAEIKKGLRDELALKKIGLVECCADQEAYEKAEQEFRRLVTFMENLDLNEQYMSGIQRDF